MRPILYRGQTRPEDLSKRQHYSAAPPAKIMPGLGRNHRCPCGSGKKFKACCLLRLTQPQEDATIHSPAVENAAGEVSGDLGLTEAETGRP